MKVGPSARTDVLPLVVGMLGRHEDQIDAMLVSVMRGVPTLNGYSGHVPPGWSLREVEAPDYEQRVARWIARYHVAGPICRLEIGD